MKNFDKTTKYGGIDVSIDIINKLVGEAVTSSYGIVGLANAKYSENKTLLDTENYKDGIRIFKEPKCEKYSVDIHVVIAYPSKITEVILEAQKKIEYTIKQTLSYSFKSINIIVEGVKA